MVAYNESSLETPQRALILLVSFGVRDTLCCRCVFGLYWQKQLVFEFQNAYFKNKTMYAANKMVPSLDNMDQVCG